MQESNLACSLAQRLSLGRYGGEKIIWKVLAVENDKILLISELGLEARGFNSQHFCSSTWEKCRLRKWLNEEFYFEAFSEGEREEILETIVSTDTDHSTYMYSWPDTKDRLFLLSATEAELYFKDDTDIANEEVDSDAAGCVRPALWISMV